MTGHGTVRSAPSGPAVLRLHHGRDILPLADAMANLYARVFSEPPWNETADQVAAFRQRITADVDRPGYRAVVAVPGSGSAPPGVGVIGFAIAARTRSPLPDDRAYPKIREQLGDSRVHRLLAGALEIDELAVHPGARRQGLGRALLGRIIGAHPRAWLVTARRAPDTVAFYHRLGWREVPPLPGRRDDVVVLLAPGHPATDEEVTTAGQ